MQPITRPDWSVRFSLPRRRGSVSLSRRMRLCCGLLCLLLLPDLAGAQMLGLKRRLYTDGATVRRAFSEVVAEARNSTVQVLNDGHRVAFGVIVGSEGWIVTKASELGPQPQVRLPNGDKVDARLEGIDEPTDLALLKVDASDLTPIEWDATVPAIGQWIISTGDRELPEAIGVVGTSKLKIARQHIAGVLGVKLDGDSGPPTVTFVFEHSGAEAAGVQAGDVVLRLNGSDVTSRGFLTGRIQKMNPGDEVQLAIRRGEDELTIDATLTHPPSDEFLSRIAIQNRMGGDLSLRRTGFEAVIQHDSVLRPEECGGPAVTLSGKAVGINIARAGRTETYTLPTELILPVINELKLHATSSVVSKE